MFRKFHPFLQKFLLPYCLFGFVIFTISACSNAIPQITSLSSKLPQSNQSESPKLVVSEVLGMTAAGGYRVQAVVSDRAETSHTAGSYTVESVGVSHE